MLQTFNTHNFQPICDQLAAGDAALDVIVKTHGYPPMWNRPNNFETLVLIILEQQVSLASAKAALNKLQEKIKKISPANVLKLTDAELKACYFSRQKTIYVRHLAEALTNRKLNLKAMEELSDDEVRARLTTLKGIGNWTVDVYLMFVLQRADIFPVGDLAAVNALKCVKDLPKDTTRERLIEVASEWQPYRSVATMLLWHFYLSAMRRASSKKEIV